MKSIVTRLKNLETKKIEKLIFGLAFVEGDESGGWESRISAHNKNYTKSLNATITAPTMSEAEQKTQEWFALHLDPLHGHCVTITDDYGVGQ